MTHLALFLLSLITDATPVAAAVLPMKYDRDKIIELPLEAIQEISQPSKEDLSFEQLKHLITDRSLRILTIEDLLRTLRNKFPQYMSRWTAMKDSQSLHGASPKRPRIIVYGERANLIITFNGGDHPEATSSEKAGFQFLEVAAFNHELKKYEFFEIEFPEEISSGNSAITNSSNESATPMISPPGGSIVPGQNQGKCLSCHQNSRPIWESYSSWPGAFGGADDFLTSKRSDLGIKQFLTNGATEVETNQWKTFNEDRKLEHPNSSNRYKYLNELQTGPVISDSVTPNLNLSIFLFHNNVKRIMGSIEKEKPNQKTKLDLLSSLACSPLLYDYGKSSELRGIQKFRELRSQFSKLACDVGFDIDIHCEKGNRQKQFKRAQAANKNEVHTCRQKRRTLIDYINNTYNQNYTAPPELLQRMNEGFRQRYLEYNKTCTMERICDGLSLAAKRECRIEAELLKRMSSKDYYIDNWNHLALFFETISDQSANTSLKALGPFASIAMNHLPQSQPHTWGTSFPPLEPNQVHLNFYDNGLNRGAFRAFYYEFIQTFGDSIEGFSKQSLLQSFSGLEAAESVCQKLVEMRK